MYLAWTEPSSVACFRTTVVMSSAAPQSRNDLADTSAPKIVDEQQHVADGRLSKSAIFMQVAPVHVKLHLASIVRPGV
jgi:hypothetical protein